MRGSHGRQRLSLPPCSPPPPSLRTLATAGPNIDNPYFPMPVGRHWTYRVDNQRDVVTVTNRTKLIANGVEARVVHDVVTEKGVPVEVTDDYYAQDAEGNVWYLGEATTRRTSNGKPASTEGSFEAGVDGAQAGIIMPAHPKVGHALPAGVLQGPRRGPREDRLAERAREGPAPPLPRTR